MERTKWSVSRDPGLFNHEKDRVLDHLAADANVAQFASFDAYSAEPRFSRVSGWAPNQQGSVREATQRLLRVSAEHRVNVRSFSPSDPKAREFVYGLESVDDVEQAVARLARAGLMTIVNETIDVSDGGVSGVALSNVIEFAPDATPRCVEEPGVASFPRDAGLRLLETVYGFRPDLEVGKDARVEFSIHPVRRGYRGTHTIIWEVEPTNSSPSLIRTVWPNHFSRFLGDKVFGLMVAWLNDLNVPQTTVLSRRVRPFTFGVETGSAEVWTRTSPAEPQPGLFSTYSRWVDPYALMQSEDPDGSALASVVCQLNVDAEFSGALLVDESGDVTMEGVGGSGEDFMLGRKGPDKLPVSVMNSVADAYEVAASNLGPVRLEWAYDGEQTWVLQLHMGTTLTRGNCIVPGDAKEFRVFDASEGLAAFRDFLIEAKRAEWGVLLRGQVGITSHFGDLLRRYGIPSRLAVD